MPRTAAPAALRLVQGRSPGRDSGGRAVPATPSFRRLAPAAPEWLPDEARAEWGRVLPDLQRLGLTKELDRAALTAYCMAWVTFRDASERYAASKADDVKPLDRLRAVTTLATASKELRAWAHEFGLTPSAEQRVAKPEAGESGAADPFE